MRSWLVAAVVVAPVGFAAAQPPAPKAPDDPPPIVITPKGGSSAPEADPEDPPGKLIIRPKRPGIAELKERKELPKKPGADAPRPPVPSAPGANTPAAPVADGKPLFDYWFAAAVAGKPIGYLRWYGREVEKNGRTVRIGAKEQRFTVARFGERVSQFGEESTVELADGQVVVTSMRQGIGRNQALALSGVVDGKTLRVTGEGMAKEASSEVPWPAGVVGAAREPLLFKDQDLKPGESFNYLTYVGQANRVVNVAVTYEGEQALALWPNTPPRTLRKYVARMDPIGPIRLPAATTWVDAETAEPYLVEFDFPGLGGRVTFLRTTEAAATAPVADPPDLFNVQSIRLDREIPGIHDRGAVVYKVSAPRDDDPTTIFPADARQRVKKSDPLAKTFELHVSAMRGPAAAGEGDPAPGPEFLGSNFFINADDPGVKRHAAAAVAGLPAGASAWEKAKAVERWVKGNMRAVEFSQAMATADNVAKTLSGDCSEYAMLAAAMCRAVGVPSRTALGLVYAPGPGGKPFLAYHMWFEAYCGGRWVPLDATLGKGGVGPGHLKVTDHSWHDEKTLAPLFPVLRVLMAKPSVGVLSVSP
ncbi:MAG: transglutaminase-like domain-containing protein [Gemmataceae bacterium]|nr:transglutaminase-like domain-containing protein [Gemmataceae bacterium]